MAYLLMSVDLSGNVLFCLVPRRSDTMADFKYGVNTDVNIGVSVTRGRNTLFEVMGIC